MPLTRRYSNALDGAAAGAAVFSRNSIVANFTPPPPDFPGPKPDFADLCAHRLREVTS